MAIIATAGAADADAYLTVAEADTYHSEDQVHTDAAWSALTTAQKEAGIKMATRVIDQMDFIGTRASSAQALSWPRIDAYRDRTILSSAIVPDPVKWATAELANWMVSEDRSAPTPGSTTEMIQVGSIKTSFRYTSGGMEYTMPDTVVKWL